MKDNKKLKEKIECLKEISLFKEIVDNQQAMQEVAELFETIAFSKGDAVVKEKIQGNSIFVIKSGTVEIVKQTMQGDKYVVTELSAEMNIFFGEVGLLDPDERSATVQCKTDCEFYMLEREKFLDYGNKNPLIGLIITRELSRILCKRLRKANNDILTLFDALVEEVEISGGII